MVGNEKKQHKKCKMCFRENKLIKAHIIPESIGEIIRGEEKNLINVYTSENEGAHFPRQSITWDESILCEECDNKLGSHEKYGVEIIKKIYFSEKRKINWNEKGYEKVPVLKLKADADKFRLFILAILYKASISQKENYEYFELGKYEAVFREWLRTGKIKDQKIIEIVIFGLAKHEKELDKFMNDSVKRIDGVKGIHLYRLIFPSLVVHVKIEKSKLPDDLKPYIYFSGTEITVPLMPVEKTPLYNGMMDSVAGAQKQNKKYRRK